MELVVLRSGSRRAGLLAVRLLPLAPEGLCRCGTGRRAWLRGPAGRRGMNAETDPPDKAPGYSWYALGVLFLVYLFNFVDRQILSILANDIKADLGLDDAQL